MNWYTLDEMKITPCGAISMKVCNLYNVRIYWNYDRAKFKVTFEKKILKIDKSVTSA